MKCTFQKIDSSVKIKLMVCGILKPIKFFNLVIVRHSTDSFQCITNWIAEVGTPINKYMYWPKLIHTGGSIKHGRKKSTVTNYLLIHFVHLHKFQKFLCTYVPKETHISFQKIAFQ